MLHYAPMLTEGDTNNEVAVILLLLIFIWLSTYSGKLLAYEVRNRTRQILSITGCSAINYWTGNLLNDIVNLCFISAPLLFIMSSQKSFFDGSVDYNSAFLTLLTLGYGTALVTLSYLINYIWIDSKLLKKFINSLLCLSNFASFEKLNLN